MAQPLLPIAVGLIASVLAGVRVIAWVGVGAWAVHREDVPTSVPLSIIVGSAITACVYAVFALLGRLDLAVGVDGAIAIAGLVCNRRIVVRRLRVFCATVTDWGGRRMASPLPGDRQIPVVRSTVWPRMIAIVWLALPWLTATAPPRDADVL